jgi:hypothetical protein
MYKHSTVLNVCTYTRIFIYIHYTVLNICMYSSNATTCPIMDLVVSPPGCGRSVTDL